jgi:hypothetical protein
MSHVHHLKNGHRKGSIGSRSDEPNIRRKADDKGLASSTFVRCESVLSGDDEGLVSHR